MSKIVLETRGLTKRFGSVTPLDSINMHVNEGEWVSIMGPSGSGKTTILNILSCLDVPTEGEYILDGVATAALTEKSPPKPTGRESARDCRFPT